MQWALAISPVTALLSHRPNEFKNKKPALIVFLNYLAIHSLSGIYPLSSVLNSPLGVTIWIQNPQYPSRNLEGNQHISSIPRALLGRMWHLWWDFFLFNIGSAQGYFFHVFFKQFAYLKFFPQATAWWSSPLHCYRYTTASHSPSYQKSLFHLFCRDCTGLLDLDHICYAWR